MVPTPDVPVRFRVHLDVVDLPFFRPEWIHARVARWLDDDEHHASRKPYAVTPLFRTDDGSAAFDVNVLTVPVARRFLERATRGAARFGQVTVGARDRRVSVVEAVSWQGLASVDPQSTWTFEFLTPTTFRTQGRYQPLPVAGSVFGHLRQVWRRFSPIPIDVDVAAAGVTVVDLEGRVESVPLRSEVLRGFVGTVTYAAAADDPEILRGFTMLGRLAAFSGVGSRTTYGMGVTRIR